MNSLRWIKQKKICRHSVRSLLWWIIQQWLAKYSAILHCRMADVHRIYSSLAFQGASGHWYSQTLHSDQPSHMTSLYDLLQQHFHFPLPRTNNVDMAKIAGSKQALLDSRLVAYFLILWPWAAKTDRQHLWNGTVIGPLTVQFPDALQQQFQIIIRKAADHVKL